MTLLKQTTVVGADDSFCLDLENTDEVQTDCCMHSITSASTVLEKELRTLTLTSQEAEKQEPSCESGIASFNENSLILQTQRAESVNISQRIGPVIDSVIVGQSAIRTNHQIDQLDLNRAADAVFHEQQVNDNNNKDLTTRRNKEKRPGPVGWDEMCEAFPDKDGDTVLHLAVLQAVTHLAGVVRLLGLQGQVNCRNRLYQTPLHLAVLTANARALPHLLRLGASLSLQDCHGNTPVHAACLKSAPDTLRTLLETDLDGPSHEDENEMSSDCANESREVVRRRREREIATALCTRNYEGFTCLHLAVLHCRHDLVLLLLRHGADVNAKDGKSGRTALHFAVDCTAPSPSIVSTLLLQPNLHINAANFAQQTALQLARGRNHHDLVDLLHVHGADRSGGFHGYYSSDSVSEEDMEDDLHVPYDDICVAGQLVTHTRCR